MIDALEGLGCRPRGRGDHVDASCPAHDDGQPSLSIDWRDGAVYLMCHGGCDAGDVVTALGMTFADLYDVPKQRRTDRPPPRAGRSTARRPRKTPAPASTTTAATQQADPYADARRWPIVERYPYVDEQGTILGWVCRKEHPNRNPADQDDNRKTFVWARPGAGNRVIFKSPERRPLYRLPDVLAAAAAGRTVWVVEGEKDADSIAGLTGECATTQPGGATKIKPDGTLAHKWLAEHTETLRGAHVVIVADRDPEEKRHVGYVHAAVVARELAGAAASVRVVAAKVGKDAHDHLAAGHSLEDFEDIPAKELAAHLSRAAAPAPATAPPPAASDGSADADVIDFPRRGGDGGGEPPIEITGIARDEYRATRDALIKIPAPREGKSPAKTGRRRAVEVINVRARLLRRVRRDLGDGAAPQVTHVDLEVARGEESVELTAVPWEDFESAKWITGLPWSDVTYRRTTQGRSDVVNAIAATSPNVEAVTAYGALGWRQLDNGPWVYIHASGAIGEQGEVSGVRVDVDPQLAVYTLPTPPDLGDIETIRAAVRGSLSLLDELPGQVGAPLLGAACRAILGEGNTSVYVTGGRGTGKSSLNADVTQHYAPSVRHNRMPFQAGEDFATMTSLEELRYIAGHSIFPAEDINPDRGADRAAQRANVLARSQFNRAGKTRGKREGGLRPTHRPRGLLVVTAEDGARGSAESRIVYVPLTPGQISDETLIRLGAAGLAEQRATLTAIMARYLAPKMPLDSWLEAKSAELSLALRDRNPSDPGVDARRCDLVADLGVGVMAMLEMAMTTGALTAVEAAEIWARAWAGLRDCKTIQAAVTDGRTLPERAAELIRSAFTACNVHIRGRKEERPDDCHLLGWEMPAVGQGAASSGFGPIDPRPGGECCGWRDGDTLLLDPGVTFAAIERQGRAEGEPLGVTKRALADALAGARLITVTEDKSQRHNHARRRIGGPLRTVWEIPLSWLWNREDPDPGGEDPAPPPPPLPGAPLLETSPQDVPEDVHTDAQDVPPAAQTPTETSADAPETSGSPTSPPAVQEEPQPCSNAGTNPPLSSSAQSTETPQHPGGGTRTASSARDAASSGATVSARAASSAARTAPRFPAMAAVLCDDLTGAWLTGPDVIEDPARLRQVDIPKLTGLPGLAEWGAKLGLGFHHQHARADDGQIWITPGAAARLGLPERAPEGKASARLVAPLEAAGWNVRHTEAWLTIWRQGGRSLRLAVVPWMAEVRVPLIKDAPDAYGLGARLAAYAAHVGLPLRMSAGVTGVDLMDRLRPPGSRLGLAEPVTAPKPAQRRTLESAYLWQRPPAPTETRLRFVHAYDKNGQYLAAASSVLLGLAVAHHLADAPAFDPKLPGLWRVSWDDLSWQENGLPDPWDPSSKGRKGADDWFATPTLAYAAELGYTVTPLEAYVYPDHGRALEPWYRQLRAARDALLADRADPDLGAVLDALKATYAAALGRLDAANTKGDRRYRPDWYAAIRSTARANLTRNIIKVADVDHRYPVAVIKDQVLYASDDPDPVSACPPALRQGNGLGAWKPYGNGADSVSTVPMEQAAARLTHTGRPQGRGGVMELFHANAEVDED